MREANFFQKQIERCNLLAEQASSQTDQEFWRQSAGRWEAILQIKTTKRPTPKPAHLSGQLTSDDDQDIAALS